MTNSESIEIEFAAYIGMDWADQQHDICLQEAGSQQLEVRQIEQKPETLITWVAQLRQRFQGGLVAIAIEQSRGALLYALMHYDFLVLYPIHPNTLANYREAFTPSGAKDDPDDAQLLLELIGLHRNRLRPWKADDPLTRTIGLLVESRRKLVNDRTRLTNRLRALLKQYFPQALTWAGELNTPLAVDFLTRWPQLSQLQQAEASFLRQFYREHGCRLGEKLEERLAEISAAHPLTTDRAVIESSVSLLLALLPQLRELNCGIARLDQQIQDLYAQHPDAEIFASLPGAGQALAPRLLAAFGADRERFTEAEEMQRYSGIAPVTKRSGKMKLVQRRLARPKFVCQSFHEFAKSSILWSSWARAYYEQQRRRGKEYHEAIRALAYKWIRIIYRCWQLRVPYDEATYIKSLELRGSPLAKLIAPEDAQA
jgi:transposase